MQRAESPVPGSFPRQQTALIKTEPEYDDDEHAFDQEVIVERIKSEAEQLYADHEVKEEMVIGPTEIQRPSRPPGAEFVALCARGGECSAELRARPTPHNNDLPHNQTETKPNKTYKGKKCFRRHINNHSHNKSFVCDICDKGFTRKYNLQSHLIVHTGQNPFTCDVCDKTFYQSRHLKSHMSIHTGEKPFTCDVCDKTFTQSVNLEMHMRIHTGVKPFTCDVCDKAFNQLGNLKRHKRIHIAEKPFACDVCGKTFNESGNFKRIHSRE